MLNFSEDNLHQLLIRYAAKCTQFSDWSPKASKNLIETLQGKDREFFTRIVPPKSAGHFPTMIERDVFLPDGAKVTLPAFIVTNETLELFFLRRHPGSPRFVPEPSPGDLWLTAYDKQAASLLFEASQALEKTGIAVQIRRVGKMHEAVFGPFPEPPAALLATKWLRQPSGEYVEAQVQLVSRSEGYNHRLVATVPPGQAGSGVIQTVFELNNFDMSKSLEPARMAQVFGQASAGMPNKMFDLLNGIQGD